MREELAGSGKGKSNLKHMRLILLTVSFLLLALSVKAQQDDYDYPTKLKGGYRIVFKTDDSLEHLYLRKEGKIIAELADGSNGMPYKNLGYLGADFQNYFVLVHSFGSGNPHEIELIKKSTGKNILKDGACWVDADEKNGYLLYTYDDMPKAGEDTMILYNVNTGLKKYLHFPPEVFKEEYLEVDIISVSANSLTIKYFSPTTIKDKRKTYNW
jgi:hypothetical protein